MKSEDEGHMRGELKGEQGCGEKPITTGALAPLSLTNTTNETKIKAIICND